MGKDHTLFATADGQVQFRQGYKRRTYVSVLPAINAAEKRLRRPARMGRHRSGGH